MVNKGFQPTNEKVKLLTIVPSTKINVKESIELLYKIFEFSDEYELTNIVIFEDDVEEFRFISVKDYIDMKMIKK